MEVCLDLLLNARTEQRPILEDVLCVVVNKGMISSKELATGFHPTFEFLPDIKVDMPLCDQWIGHLIGRLAGESGSPLDGEKVSSEARTTVVPTDFLKLFNTLHCFL